jgi:hypothetical protein
MRRLRFVVPVVSLIVVLVLTTLASAQGALSPGAGSVNFTVQNLDASEDASVIASYINENGVADATIPATIAPQSSAGFNIADSGLADNWQGSVIVSGDREIVAFAQARWENGTFGDGKTAGAYNGFTAGANALYFPSLAARDGKQISRLSIQSAEGASESETIDVTIAFFNRDGTAAKAAYDISLLKGTQQTIDLMDESLGDNWLGAAVVSSASPIAGVSTMHWKEYSGAYSGVTGGGTVAYLPSITRRLPNGPWLQYTAVLVQNLSTDTAANVTVAWYDRDGVELHSFVDAIPANSSHGYNTRWTTSDVPDHDALHTALGDNFNGSVGVTSDGPDIVAIANLQWTADSPVGNAATAYSSEPSGYAEIFVPANFRRVTAGTWKQFTGLIVQNVGASACTDFGVEWRDRDGVLLLDYTDTLDLTGQSHGYNSRYGGGPMGDSSVLGDDFRGSVYFDAPGCELIAIHNTLWPLWTDSTTYNAFGK